MPKTMIDFKKSFGDSFECGQVTNIDLEAKTVTLDNGKTVTYTDLVIAVGSNGPLPTASTALTEAEATEQFQQFGEEIKKATNIIIIGGGPVGVEYAGEIMDKFKDKKIKVIHSRDYLVDEKFGPAFQSNLKSSLEAKEVEILLGKGFPSIIMINLND